MYNKYLFDTQKEALKALMQDKKVFWGEDGKYIGNLWISIDGYAAFMMPKKDFYINLPKNGYCEMTFKKFVEAEDRQQPLQKTALMERLEKADCHILEAATKEKIYIDSKLLKKFGSYTCLHFTGITQKSAVYVYQDDLLLGIIMPILHK